MKCNCDHQSHSFYEQHLWKPLVELSSLTYGSYYALTLQGLMFAGVEIYCAPTADSRDVWQASMTHIALEGGCFVLSANQFCQRKDYPPPPEYLFSGTEEELTPDSVVCAGGSVIISPSGAILAGPNYDGEALISADLGLYCYI